MIFLIQHFEADLLKILNSGIILKTFTHLYITSLVVKYHFHIGITVRKPDLLHANKGTSDQSDQHLYIHSLLSLMLQLATCIISIFWLASVAEQVSRQWRSKNTEKVTHIKGRLLDQAVILFNCVLFLNGNFS